MKKLTVLALTIGISLSSQAYNPKACEAVMKVLDACSIQNDCDVAEIVIENSLSGSLPPKTVKQLSAMCKIVCENPTLYVKNRGTMLKKCWEGK